MKSKWYLANIILYSLIKKKSKISKRKDLMYWDNMVLFKALNPEQAYQKAIKYGKESEEKRIDIGGNETEWKFAGVRDLVQALNDLNDEQELTYREFFVDDISKIKKLIPSKKSLGIFIYDKYYKKHKTHSNNYILMHRQRND